MGNIPSDPIILLSFVNMKLRDEGLSLDNFCERYDTKRQDLKSLPPPVSGMIPRATVSGKLLFRE